MIKSTLTKLDRFFSIAIELVLIRGKSSKRNILQSGKGIMERTRSKFGSKTLVRFPSMLRKESKT